MNDKVRREAAIKRMFKQFNAGVADPENLTELSMIPYFLLSRLSDDFNKAGLGFSRESMGSIFDLAKNIMLKRVIPMALAANYYEYLDDTSQDLTGTSITGAISKGAMNVDLATRRTLDAFGITEWLKAEKKINPIMQYWGNKTEFMSYSERLRWYDSGYEPVRKGAWWIFGSVNEARGGEIQYWQPSFVRRIESDYEDISLYGDNREKWAHSWLPTPTHPLSTFRALLNPYWLEDLHEDDRPYAVSGSLFADGTPWGAVLNPTVGQLIKPRKELHPYRLHNGVDVKNLLREMNEYIRVKARDFSENNLISVNGDNLSASDFTAWNAPDQDTSIDTYQFGLDGYGGGGYYPNLSAAQYRHGVYCRYTQPLIDYSDGFNKMDERNVKYLVDNDGLFSSAVDAVKNNFGIGKDALNHLPSEIESRDGDIIADKDGKFGVFRISDNDYEAIQDAKDMLRNMNEAIKHKPPKIAKLNTFDKSEEMISPETLKHYQPSRGMDLLNHPDEIAEMINVGNSYDYIHNAAISARLITGIYGYMLGEATGIGVDNQKMIPTSQNMTSFSRSFWDSNIGDAGGDVMEIARRFIPDFRRGNRISPLLNEMPDWLPDRFKFGDPMAILPKGEMRLPGAGYESLNKLHPDIFGDYGTFDRYKILADIAPFSPEYKLWRELAKETVTDPNLIAEMDEIRERVTLQGKNHDFYDYRLKDRGLTYDTVIVSEVLDNGKFRSGDDTVFKLAGVRVKGNDSETAAEVFGRYLHVGDKITVAVDNREGYKRNRDIGATINAAVFVNGKNLSEVMLDNGDAVIRKGDNSTAALLTGLAPFQKLFGYASEIVAHTDVPWLSDQFLRVRSPMEAYKAEEIYGTPYQSWNHPLQSFLYPAAERAIYEDYGIRKPAFTFAYKAIENIKEVDPLDKKLLAGAYLLSNRGAFIGAAVSNLIFPGNAKKAMFAADVSRKLIDLAHIWKGGHSYLEQGIYSAMLGDTVARFFEKNRVKGAVMGALAGTAIRTLRGGVDYDYIPDRTKQKWQWQEYFDRLTHLKYLGLYHVAAEKALAEEGIDVEAEIEKREWLKNRKEDLSNQLEALGKSLRVNMRESPFRDVLLSSINSRIDALKDKQTITNVGKYTHSAILYKQAAERTMAGLKQGASWSQIIAALPKNDREYFIEFVKEQDADKRSRILKIVSPFLRKALSLAWYNKLPDDESDREYFSNFKIPFPDANWRGWRPDVNLSDVEVKTIENEERLLSDFGYYESELRKPSVIDAPTLNEGNSTYFISREIKRVLNGAGLKNVEVNVTDGLYGSPTNITTDIKLYISPRQSADKIRRAVENNVA